MSYPLNLGQDLGSTSDARAALLLLEAERRAARTSRVAANELYMADLERELEEAAWLYTVNAVTEIATLRAELTAPRQG